MLAQPKWQQCLPPGWHRRHAHVVGCWCQSAGASLGLSLAHSSILHTLLQHKQNWPPELAAYASTGKWMQTGPLSENPQWACLTSSHLYRLPPRPSQLQFPQFRYMVVTSIDRRVPHSTAEAKTVGSPAARLAATSPKPLISPRNPALLGHRTKKTISQEQLQCCLGGDPGPVCRPASHPH
jgi:hypothetical protein